MISSWTKISLKRVGTKNYTEVRGHINDMTYNYNIQHLIIGIVQFLVIVLLSPFFAGFIHKLKQRARGQKGINIFQFYINFNKLLKKEVVLSKDATFISNIAPYIVFVSYLVILLMLPAFYRYSLLGISSDVILIAYSLALATFFMTLYAMDQGSAFGGLGASREWFLTVLSEPSLIFIFISLAIYTKQGRITDIFYFIQKGASNAFLYGVHSYAVSIAIPFLLFISLFIVSISENARIPIDNPETHLELTMFHEANILEASGKHLGIYEYGSYLKLTVFLTVMSLILFPYMAVNIYQIPMALIVYILKMIILCILIAGVEIVNPKMRVFRVPNVLSVSFILSLIAMILSIRGF
ncbi:MAG: NADH-quinone oxidoreductase subunit H [Deltaproteobacteria bacterium]|nr:NADH-quinone oxidoreductase subunit H [Deltaproteobacteria bacterium]MCL5891571.1 NADH-quinone oxidoreductase subunit H [Deltaproteobacteria bacterium]